MGSGDNPTPTGIFYFTDPVDLANQRHRHGVFALGLSGHSDVLRLRRRRRPDRGARHDQPERIGKGVSHGCMRVDNDTILKLSKSPLGTPVVIT